MTPAHVVKAMLETDPDAPGDLARQAFPPQYAHVLDDPNTPDWFIHAFYSGEHKEMDGDGHGTVPQFDHETQQWWATEYSKGYITNRHKLWAKWDYFNQQEEWESLELAGGSMPEVGSPQEKLIDYRVDVYEPAQQWLEYAEYVERTGDDPLRKYSETPRHGQTPELHTDMTKELARLQAEANKTAAGWAQLKRELGATD